ncbi:uncharacterized protein LOC113547996 isoform X2 [Rhopalosiphum maidis]|uniref:uncharacterized protein LOC113547996 isoform X2 n=1 Tax=Rhopalosiphum maidis TaxID=43146 RepID=UPI000F00F6A9|nr:uncharacterized protein LOC113547996 isoform X2 [Rhopalosiphum maidis]
MTTKNRAKSLIAAALIGKAFKNNNIPSTVIKDNEKETFEATGHPGERINSNITTKRLKKICGEENDRKNILDNFWKLGSKSNQRDFLTQCVYKGTIQRKRNKLSSRRTISYKYYLFYMSEKKQVCQQFLISTLDISQKFLTYTIKHFSLESSGKIKNYTETISKSKLDNSTEYADLQEEKTRNPNVSIETITENSLSSDVSCVSTNCLIPTKENYNNIEIKSSVSENKSYNDIEPSKINNQSKIHELSSVDKNITDISGSAYLNDDLFISEEIQPKEIKIIKQKCSLKNNNIKLHAVNSFKNTFGGGKCVKSNPCVLNKKCQHKCWEKFTENDRKNIFDNFWKLGSKPNQRDYLIKCVFRGPIKRKRNKINSRRSISNKYYLSYMSEQKQVCQQFLLTTLDITQKFLIYTIENYFQANSVKNNCRKTITKVQLDNSAIFKLDQFLQQLPALSSRYCSTSSNKKYLPAEIVNILGLYNFYKDYCKINGDEPLSKYIFRNTFKKQYNLGFHVPKKDSKCNLCIRFEKTYNSNSKPEIQKSHLNDLDECKTILMRHLQITDPGTVCASFDLQNSLNTPIGYDKNLYYSRKFSVSNLIVIENITQNSYCYLWGETIGNRGSNEIVSCIHDYLIKVDQRKSVKSVILLCNSNARRNKNKAMLLMMYHALEYELNFITEIKLIFLLPGHTCLPVDSLILTIDRFIKNKTVWVPSEWPTLIRNARSNSIPLEIVEMKTSNFFDWTLVSSSFFSNHFKTNEGETISTSKLRSVLFQKQNNNIKLLISNSYTDVCPEKLVILKKRRRNVQKSEIPCYTEHIGISSAKFNDLTKLCKDGIIPEKFHKEYYDMKSNKNVKDCLNETDDEDEEY